MNVATVALLPAAAALMRADAMRVLVWLRPTMARFAPSAASASAAARPMPLVAPVIRICLVLRARLFKAMPSADDLSDGLGLALQPPANGASGLEFCCEHHGSPRGIIAADVRRFGRLINKDGVLGTHNKVKRILSLPARLCRSKMAHRVAVLFLRVGWNAE